MVLTLQKVNVIKNVQGVYCRLKRNNHRQCMNIDWILVQKIKEREKERRVRGREGGGKKEGKRKEEETMKYIFGTIGKI